MFTVNIIQGTTQAIHCKVTPNSGSPNFFCSYVYGFNEAVRRLELWKFLKQVNTSEPWIICGDMNCVMQIDERIGALVSRRQIECISQCMDECSMNDVKATGNLFTSNNKQQGAARVFYKKKGLWQMRPGKIVIPLQKWDS